MDLEQSLAVTLAKAHRRRSQELEYRASLTKLQARDGAFVCYGEFIAVPEPYQEARITDALHNPADYGMIKFPPNETLAGIDTHSGHLSAEASFKYWHYFLFPAIADCRSSYNQTLICRSTSISHADPATKPKQFGRKTCGGDTGNGVIP
jgi:hypothetical protein